ncbi:hypothetical protein MPL1032_220020 [Mesorhizobium plurifarium]|uniref:Uncharacterized protein n=1 Tax=Mesorhizobium plurifarium TaxID=69974 RepID=A0A0K2VZF3_MESPL|nr:hypothetical protein MPL1032_220020 [Mesorhizobium plurifarium]
MRDNTGDSFTGFVEEDQHDLLISALVHHFSLSQQKIHWRLEWSDKPHSAAADQFGNSCWAEAVGKQHHNNLCQAAVCHRVGTVALLDFVAPAFRDEPQPQF